MAFPLIVFQATGLAAELNIKGGDYSGPVSYQTGGMTVSASAFGLSLGVYSVLPMDLTVSGNFYVRVISPAGARVKQVVIKWFVLATNAEVGNGVNLSAERVRFTAFGV